MLRMTQKFEIVGNHSTKLMLCGWPVPGYSGFISPSCLVFFVFQPLTGFCSLTCPGWTCARVTQWPGTCLAWAQRLMCMGSCSRATLCSFRAWGRVQPCSFLTPLSWPSCSLTILVSASSVGPRFGHCWVCGWIRGNLVKRKQESWWVSLRNFQNTYAFSILSFHHVLVICILFSAAGRIKSWRSSIFEQQERSKDTAQHQHRSYRG